MADWDSIAADQSAKEALAELKEMRAGFTDAQNFAVDKVIAWIKTYAFNDQNTGRQGAGYKRLIQPLIGVGRHQSLID